VLMNRARPARNYGQVKTNDGGGVMKTSQLQVIEVGNRQLTITGAGCNHDRLGADGSTIGKMQRVHPIGRRL
jgi:hypothetical protein